MYSRVLVRWRRRTTALCVKEWEARSDSLFCGSGAYGQAGLREAGRYLGIGGVGRGDCCFYPNVRAGVADVLLRLFSSRLFPGDRDGVLRGSRREVKEMMEVEKWKFNGTSEWFQGT